MEMQSKFCTNKIKKLGANQKPHVRICLPGVGGLNQGVAGGPPEVSPEVVAPKVPASAGGEGEAVRERGRARQRPAARARLPRASPARPLRPCSHRRL